MLKYEYIIVEKQDGLAKVTLNRPEIMNAWNPPMRNEIAAAFESFASDDEVRAVLLTGAGRGFCAGHDRRDIVGDVDGKDPDRARASGRSVLRLFTALNELKKPVVAMVNGPAMGGGCNLALWCDIIIAAEDARFSQVFSRIGIVPEWASSYNLLRLVGKAKATELILTGRTIDGREAERIGMIYKAVPSEELEQTAMGLARQLAKGPTKTLGMAKVLLQKAWHMDAMQTFLYEQHLGGINLETEDSQEGARALRDKREPQFKGR